ncbi:MAG: lipid-A-disaccharide synthase [Brachymonas sp.]|nr:lipid-A-disaccharide synthase [Brachymonas sp.]
MNTHQQTVSPPLRLAMVAGEASGDLLASLLLQGARAHWPALQASGIGGPRMQAEGFVAHWPSEKLAVHGFSLEVLKRVAGIWRIRNQLRARLLQERPDVFIGVDAPDFNLGLEESLREKGIKTVHFVCPSIWAWRPERVHALKRCADHVLCLFPFEPELLQQHGIAATYVGHPLASVFPMQPDRRDARRALGLDETGEVLALLPGSRKSEIRYLAERFLQAAQLLRQRRPGLRIVLPAAPGHFHHLQAWVRAQNMQDVVTVLDGQSHTALTACDVTLIASGTATLEAALLKRPMVIAYAMHPWSAKYMSRKQLQPWVGLPNILCREFVVPELIQDNATPEKLADAVDAWFQDPARIAAVQQRFSALHTDLQRDTAALSAHAIQELLAR